MQTTSQLNYEELGAEVAKLDTHHAEVHQASAAMRAPQAALDIPAVCNIYRTVKPFLALIGRIPFIPAKIKEAINAFMGAMDMLCP